MTGKQINLQIGTLEDMGERFVAAWKAAEQGKRPAPDKRSNITFLGLESFVSVMSPKRLELLRALRRLGPLSVRALASHLARDYKSVHGDVAMLEDAGLIERTKDNKIAVTWDEINARMQLAG